MKFDHTDHTKIYFYKCKSIAEELIQVDWKSINGNIINLNNGGDNLKYKILKFSTKLSKRIEKTNNKKINLFLDDPNILSLGLINMKAKSEVKVHKDHDYWSHLFYRVHIPINSTGAFFTYGDEKIVWEMGKVYMFDVMDVLHGAFNGSDQDFEMIYIDISQNSVNEDLNNFYVSPEDEKILLREDLQELKRYGYSLHSIRT